MLMTADTVGGVWTYALELAREFVALGVEVHIATMGAPLSAHQRTNLPDVGLYESRYRLEWMQDCWDDVARAGEWLMALESDIHPDVVHLNQYAFGALPLDAPTVLVAHSCVVSWWQAVHGCAAPPQWDEYRDAVERGLEGSDLVIAPTAAMLGSLTRNYGFRRGGVVIPNGRRSSLFNPAAKAPFIAAAGRLWDAAKNIEALEAVAPALSWPIRIAGSNTHPDGGVCSSADVQMLGELSPEALAAELARASIYALPARYEPFGLSVLEAGLCGCALVLGDVPSLREVWENAALYVPPDDHGALRRVLQDLIADDRLRCDMAQRARRRAIHYAPERMAQHYLLAYARAERSRASTHGTRMNANANAWGSACAS